MIDTVTVRERSNLGFASSAKSHPSTAATTAPQRFSAQVIKGSLRIIFLVPKTLFVYLAK
jgi:hypothetical protein